MDVKLSAASSQHVDGWDMRSFVTELIDDHSSGNNIADVIDTAAYSFANSGSVYSEVPQVLIDVYNADHTHSYFRLTVDQLSADEYAQLRAIEERMVHED